MTVLDTSAAVDYLVADGVADRVGGLLSEAGPAAAPDLLVFGASLSHPRGEASVQPEFYGRLVVVRSESLRGAARDAPNPSVSGSGGPLGGSGEAARETE